MIKALEFGVVGGLFPLLPKAGRSGAPDGGFLVALSYFRGWDDFLALARGLISLNQKEKTMGAAAFPGFWREAGDFDFPFHSHQQSNSPPLRLRSGQALSRKNRETRTGPLKIVYECKPPAQLELGSRRWFFPTSPKKPEGVGHPARRDRTRLVYFMNERVGPPLETSDLQHLSR